MQPEAFAVLKQLKSLSLLYVQFYQGSRLLELLVKLAQLPLLAELAVLYDPHRGVDPPTAPFTAPLISTQLQCLQLGISCRWSTQDLASGLFSPGTVYPHLHLVDLVYKGSMDAMRLRQPQLQQLCSSSPAVDHLAISMCSDMTPTALQPLLQLSALTHLEVYETGCMDPAAAEAAVHTVAQLAGLRQLKLWGLPLSLVLGRTHPSWLQLKALAALEKLNLQGPRGAMDELWFSNKVS